MKYVMTQKVWLKIFCMAAAMVSIQTISAQNYVTTFAGNGTAANVDGDTLTASFNQPSDIDRDFQGNLIVVDMNNIIRKISTTGAVTTVAGTGVAGYLDGPGATAKFSGALNACVDQSGNIYVSDFANQRIRKIDVNGVVTTIAGNGIAGYKDTTALESEFNYPRGICIDQLGNLYVADSWNHRIRKIDTNGNVTTFAGGGNSMGVQSPGDYVDGQDTSARFWTPCGLEIDNSGNLFLADAYNHRIRMITPLGVVSTVAGSGLSGSSNGAYNDGPVSSARFNTPTGLGIDALGNIYVADTYNNCVRLISNGNVTTAAGSTSPGFINGNSASALLNHPRCALMDVSGNHIYIPDGNNHVIRKITLNLTLSSLTLLSDQSIDVFPNPATNFIEVNLSGIHNMGTISLINFLGEPVLEVELNANDEEYKIEIPKALSHGQYLLMVSNNQGFKYVTPIMIE